MNKWEYKVVNLDRVSIDDLGDEGWELVSVVFQSWDDSSEFLGYFKRIKIPNG